MEVVVGTEYGGVGSTLNNLPYLDEAMTHRYHQFCSGGSWTALCVNCFWGYMQAILEAADLNLASANKEYAYSLNGTGTVTSKAQAIITSSMNSNWAVKDACGGGYNLCEWATIRKDVNNEFYGYLSGEADGVQKFFILQDTHIYWLYSDQAFVITPFVDVRALWADYAKDSAKDPQSPDYSMVNFK